jgi:ankyrin repeat protein
LKHPSLDIEVRDTKSSTVLLHACQIGKMTAINTLLDRGADIRAKDIKHQNALHLFLSSGFSSWHESDRERADRLVLRKRVVERMTSLAPELLTETDAGGRTPLHCSLQHDPLIPSDVETLLDIGADVTAVITRTKDNPLHLLLGGAFHIDINARNRAGETPAFHFFRQGSLEATMPPSDTDEAIVKTFESADEHWRRQDLQRKRKCAVAVDHEYRLWNVFEMSGLDWSATSKSGKTLLHIVAADVNKEYVGRRPARFQFLMGKGLDVLAEDDRHQTALDIAASLGGDDILEMFRRKD